MAASDERWRLVCYDVRDPKRYRKVYRIIRGHGRRLQYSVFRCLLDDLRLEQLRWRLAGVMDDEDSLLIIDLCPRCASRTISKNHVSDWEPTSPQFRLIGTTHEPPADDDASE